MERAGSWPGAVLVFSLVAVACCDASDSTTNGGSGPGTEVGTPGPDDTYGPCDGNCHDPNDACIYFGLYDGVCSPICMTDADCPKLADHDATPACEYDSIAEEGYCELTCSAEGADGECPPPSICQLGWLGGEEMPLCRPESHDEPEPECTEEVMVVAYGDQTPLGYSAEDVLPGFLGDRTSTLTFMTPGATLADWVLDVYDVTASLSYGGGEVRYVESTGPDPGACADEWVEVDVTFSFVSADGGFNETIPATARLDLDDAQLSHEFESDDLSGSFDFATMIEAGTVTNLSLGAGFDGTSTSGEFVGEVHSEEGPGGVGYGTIGQWGEP